MRVLVVEDEIEIANDIMAGLEDAGFFTQLCRNGQDAWFLGSTEDYDAIVLDLGLPQLDGLTVLRRLRSEQVMVPIIVLTARGSWAERVEGINTGADDYLPKPFQMAELVARLRALLRRAHGVSSPLMSAGSLRLDTAQMEATVWPPDASDAARVPARELHAASQGTGGVTRRVKGSRLRPGRRTRRKRRRSHDNASAP